MPLPTDQNLLDLSDKILATFAQIFASTPGFARRTARAPC